MRKVADHLLGRLTFEALYSRATNYFWNIGRPREALEPDVRISRDGTGKPVQLNGAPRPHLSTWLRVVAMPGNQNMLLRFALTWLWPIPWSQACSHRANFADSIPRMELPLHPALYWQRCR